jgi:hypothetical protein
MSKAEDYIREHTRHCSNVFINPQLGGTEENHPWLTPDQARKAIEIAKEEELEYIKYQLDLRLPEILDYNGVQVDREDFINDFIKAMKDE